MLFTNYLLRSHFGANAEVGAYSALGLHQAGRPADGLSVVLAGPLIFLELVRHRKRCAPIVCLIYVMFVCGRSSRASVRRARKHPAAYKSGPGAPLSGTARAARASCTEFCCCPSKTGTVEGSSAASKTSDEGPGASILCTCIFLGKQILPCPASCCWSNFLLLPRLRFFFID